MKSVIRKGIFVGAMLFLSSISLDAHQAGKKQSGLYEIVFINTTDESYLAKVDLYGDIEQKEIRDFFKTGGDRSVFVQPMTVNGPSIQSTSTNFLINKITIFTEDGKKILANYNVPASLRGKDWVGTIKKQGTDTSICFQWAHTRLQGQATMAAEFTGILAGAVAAGAAIGAGVAATSAGTASAAAASGLTASTITVGKLAGATALMDSAGALVAIIPAGEAVATAGAATTGALEAGAMAGAIGGATAGVATTTLLAALDAAGDSAEKTIKSMSKKIGDVFGLSRELQKAPGENGGCKLFKRQTKIRSLRSKEENRGI